MYAYNPQLSVLLSQKYSSKFQERACYDNVYQLITDYFEELQPSSKLRVLFCYRLGSDDIYYRHVFCVFDGQLVEPLLYLDMSDYNRERIVPVKELSYLEYLNLLVKDEQTSLRDSLYQDELEAVRNSGIFRSMGAYDLSQLYREIDETWSPEPEETNL